MNIDWVNFTPLAATAGGVLIGLAAALFVLLNGRIAGISGIVGGLMEPSQRNDIAWRLAFAAGLVAAPLVYRGFASLPAMRVDASLPLLIVAGLLVGFGSRLASGCTSGHGVCGISRLSPRSLLATAIFMVTGIVTVFVVRHLLTGAEIPS